MEITKKLDHKFHLSYITDYSSKESYLCYSCKQIIPNYTRMEKRNGPSKPERLKLYPAREILKVYITNKIDVWEGELSYEINNLTRVKPGGRDETWTESVFFTEIQTSLQYPYLNSYIFQLRKIEDDTINFEVKLRTDTVVNYFKSCQLTKLNELSLSFQNNILDQIVTEEKCLIKFYCTNGNIEKLRMILDRNSSVLTNLNFIDDGWSPIQLAAYRGHMDVVSYLIEKGANVNIKSTDGMDPLFCSLKGKHTNIFLLLAQNGAQIICNENSSNDGIESHLTFALSCQLKEVVEYICRPGGEKMMELEALHGTRNSYSQLPHRFFTTIDGYPVETSSHVEVKKKKVKSKTKEKDKQNPNHPNHPYHHVNSHHITHHKYH